MEEFGLCRNSVKKMWGIRGKVDVISASTKTALKRGRRLALDEVVQLVQAVPLCQRQTQRSLAAASGIPRTTLQRYLADGTLRRAALRVKPALTAGHKTKRLQCMWTCH
ncbi:hypothetical protein L917_09750 [Phytophthora nicotianae]|uniref:Transposase Tc1-like domain-containing protein n=2 Tax=Phytophthora nicotianae TaxID=4792 RepID=W2RA64_PHYN3|nr:hypothetical protein PPTG_21081 [Phytophthora nicotianae INRA-310]ETL91732.1 hypothetical protein L917_09750 [Phytophthora nicotianae]ETM43179.1 hypothetical protein L914_11291 [Phytophthora nicotianae]ETN21430.1 hypothetical protein PPTG_21081 [Phytophthora nicotianae INRA-310]